MQKSIENRNLIRRALRHYRKKRTIHFNKGIVVQESIGKINEDTIFKKIPVNKYFKFINDNFVDVLRRAQKFIFSDENNIDKNFGSIQLLYCFEGANGKTIIRHTQSEEFRADNSLNAHNLFSGRTDVEKLFKNIKAFYESSGAKTVWLGYTLILKTKGNRLNKKTIYNLKAFSPSSNRKYHEMTVASTSFSRICIYETFLHVTGRMNLKYMRNNKEKHDEILKMLKEEGSEIEEAVKKGELCKSLELLSTKYNEEYLICFFGFNTYYEPNVKEIMSKSKKDKQPIFVFEGKAREIKTKSLIKFIGKYMFLYEPNDLHVAPGYYKPQNETELKKLKEIKRDKFILRVDDKNKKDKMKEEEKKEEGFYDPENLNDDDYYKNVVETYPGIGSVLGFDFETYLDKDRKCNVFNGTIYGIKGKDLIKTESFYGKNSIDEFINYIDEISTPVNYKKSRPKNPIPNIHIYGFNNSRFDNLFIYEKLFEKNAGTEYIFAGSSIKYIKYNNIKFFDISCHYKLGGLRDTCKKFKLEEEKGVFPHKFVTEDNLYYKGKIPDIEFWNSKEDYDEYCSKYKSFDMKTYCEKYCMLDSKLVYELAMIHLNNCHGIIRKRPYDVSRCVTSAGLSLKIFTQCFLDEDLYQSPDKIIEKERLAYKGGRTEVFKKKFLSDSKTHRLYYYDINSAYPAGMLELMPYKYIKTIVCEEHKPEINDIVDHNLYLASTKYIGKNKFVIPNLLLRDVKGDIIACKNSDYAYHWGIEIKEAIKNNFEVNIKEVNEYEGKKIFEEFSTFFYNERLKVKKTNEALSLFYKNVLNSLYGKFGQKPYNKTALCKNTDEVFSTVNGDSSIIVNFEIHNDNILVEYKDIATEYESIGKLIRFASYITSTARCRLSEVMRDVGHENIYYCDTDSIFTVKKPSDKYLDNNILGKWKLEDGGIITKAFFLAPKCYHYESEEGKQTNKSKGIKDGSMIPSEYEDLVEGRVRKVAKTADMFFRSLECIKISPQERNIQCVYDKRIWYNNDSEPFESIEKWNKNKTLMTKLNNVYERFNNWIDMFEQM